MTATLSEARRARGLPDPTVAEQVQALADLRARLGAVMTGPIPANMEAVATPYGPRLRVIDPGLTMLSVAEWRRRATAEVVS